MKKKEEQLVRKVTDMIQKTGGDIQCQTTEYNDPAKKPVETEEGETSSMIFILICKSNLVFGAASQEGRYHPRSLLRGVAHRPCRGGASTLGRQALARRAALIAAGQDRRQALRSRRATRHLLSCSAIRPARRCPCCPSPSRARFPLATALLSTGAVALAEIGDKTQLLACCWLPFPAGHGPRLGHPGGHRAEPRAGGLAGRAGGRLAHARRAALGRCRQLHRHRAVDAGARLDRSRAGAARAARSWPPRSPSSSPRSATRPRYGAARRALRPAVGSGGGHHAGHAGGERAGGASGEPICRPPAPARCAHRSCGGVRCWDCGSRCAGSVEDAILGARLRELAARPCVPPFSWIRDLLSRAWARPDGETMLQFGAGGELLVYACGRCSALILLLPPLHAASGGGDSIELMIGLGAAVLVNVMAQVWLALARRRRLYRWLPYATGTYDVTATTGVLALRWPGANARPDSTAWWSASTSSPSP